MPGQQGMMGQGMMGTPRSAAPGVMMNPARSMPPTSTMAHNMQEQVSPLRQGEGLLD